MSVKATFNNIEYDLVYNEQSGFYEIEIEAPKTGGIYNAEITFKYGQKKKALMYQKKH